MISGYCTLNGWVFFLCDSGVETPPLGELASVERRSMKCFTRAGSISLTSVIRADEAFFTHRVPMSQFHPLQGGTTTPLARGYLFLPLTNFSIDHSHNLPSILHNSMAW